VTFQSKFTSKERDAETGLDFFGARYMSSAQGRFTSPDDFLKDSDVRDPQSWNKYAYVRNNPLKLVDPKGEAATVSTTCTNRQDGQTTCQVNIQASVAIYAANGSGLSNNQLKETAAAIKKGTEGSWQGTFTKDGVAYNVTSAVTVSIVGSEKAGVNSGAQNVIGITNGNAMAGGTTSFVADRVDHPFSASDRGMFSYQAITGNNNTAAHEMGHLFGGRDFFAGDAILNQDPNSHSPRMTRTDFNDVLRSVSPQTGTRTVRAFWFGRLGF